MGAGQIGMLSRRSGRSRLGGAAAHDLQAPRASALEQLVRVDLVSPAEEMRFGIIVRRAENREPLLGFIGGGPAVELFQPPPRPFGGRAPPLPPPPAANTTPARFFPTP